jgi:anti-anti-sigma factor
VVAPAPPIGFVPVTPLAVSVDLPRAQVRVTGELDRESAHHLVDAMVMLTTRSNPRWRLDAGDVTFCDAEGLRALSSAHALAAAHGRSLQLVRTSRPVERLVELLGHDRVFPAAARPAATGRRQRRDADDGPVPRRPGATPAWARRIRCGTTGTP